uniref:Uncharacterized protein n=1 Tax=Aegilops tauschii TaxID=37682 RepID=M8CE55_AEGTA
MAKPPPQPFTHWWQHQRVRYQEEDREDARTETQATIEKEEQRGNEKNGAMEGTDHSSERDSNSFTVKAGKTKQGQEADRVHVLQSASTHGQAARMSKGCAAFLVGNDGEAPRRLAVPVTLLGHPAIVELLAEAWEKYGYAHEGVVVVPWSVERFQRAVDAARAQERHHHHHYFRLPHLAGCFRPPHVVA